MRLATPPPWLRAKETVIISCSQSVSSKRLEFFEAEGCDLFSLIRWSCPYCLELGHKDERETERRKARGREKEEEEKEDREEGRQTHREALQTC